MNDWWKLALAGAAAAGLTAATGGLAAPLLGGLGEGAAAAGAVGAGEAAAAGTAAAGAAGAEAAGTAGLLATEGAGASAAGGATGGLLGTSAVAAPEATGAMAYTTPSIFAEAPVAEGMMPGAYSDVAGEQFAAQNPSLWTQAQGYAGKAGKAASTFSAVNGAMGGNQPPHQAPQGHPVYQGEAPRISQPQQAPMDNQFAQMLLRQRQQRGMLG